ncbi:hypothetical protein GCM10010420_10680 [Streptomyces glaucosporus]|uniref:Uncharacterized protein n=1 Tax=Streptomyces glaucosporus TaxID=284044 RepID=A0ABN3HVJ6_9ACTN
MTPEEMITVADEIEHLDPANLARMAIALDELFDDTHDPGLQLLADLVDICFDEQV